MVGKLSSPMVTTVAPTMPVDAAKNAPTTTTETAKPPGSGPNTRAIVVSRSLAIFERSKVMPIITNINTASNTSIEAPDSTRSFIRLTMNEILVFIACSQPRSNTGWAILGKSGFLNMVILSGCIPVATIAS